jgi:hypothetical protein
MPLGRESFERNAFQRGLIVGLLIALFLECFVVLMGVVFFR